LDHGPAGWRQRARLANSTASGRAATKAIRTRLAVSAMRAPILIRRIRKVVNSAQASACVRRGDQGENRIASSRNAPEPRPGCLTRMLP
jgi:hypothetical protein